MATPQWFKNVTRPVLRFIGPWAGFVFYRAVHATWRIDIQESTDLQHGLAARTPIVYAHWHGDELGILHLLKPYRACAMISTSEDGAVMDRVVRLMGAVTSRGSSTRGGVSALRGILRLAKDGWLPSVAVDGPKGPRHKVKAGIFEISKVTGGKIIPVGVACSNAWRFEKAWNKTYMPKPFAKVSIVFGPALPAIGRDQDPHDTGLASTLEVALSNAERQARGILAGA